MVEVPDIVSSLLIDTCLLIDSREYSDTFSDFLKSIKSKGITTYSIELVKAEFTRARTELEIKTKLEYFYGVVDGILPVEKIAYEENLKGKKDETLVALLKSYGQDLDGVSITDLYLALCLYKYKDLFLMTANHKDFPIFTREKVLPFEMRRGVKTYALYRSYS